MTKNVSMQPIEGKKLEKAIRVETVENNKTNSISNSDNHPLHTQKQDNSNTYTFPYNMTSESLW